MITKKPMLAVDYEDVKNIQFPVYASPKLDGVRGLIDEYSEPARVRSRTLKLIPNIRVQNLLKDVPVGFDGELIAGDPTAKDAYRKTVSMVMSDDKDISGLALHVFDIQADGPYTKRLIQLQAYFYDHFGAELAFVPQTLVYNVDDLLALEEENLTLGYEGLILRAPNSPYKHGRSTLKEGYLLKMKRFADGEAFIEGVTELMHNDNEAKTNELGHTSRGHQKAGMRPSGTMGTMVVKDIKTDIRFEIGTGFDADERASFMPAAENLTIIGETEGDKKPIYATEHAGRLVKYRHFLVGAKDKPRHPSFQGFRAPLDIDPFVS